MQEIKLTVNRKIEVLVENNVLKTVVLDVADTFLAIAIPVKNGQYYVPQKGELIEAVFYEGKEVYKFESLVVGRRTEKNLPQILLAYPQKIEEVQRRQFVRVPVSYYVQYEKLQENTAAAEIEDKLDTQAAHQGIMLDISGGGFRLKINETAKLGDKIIADIPCNEGNIRVKGQVVRLEKTEDDKFVCGVSFSDIDNRTREQIIRYIFTLMRKQRKTL